VLPRAFPSLLARGRDAGGVLVIDDKNLVRVYGDKTYVSTTTVRHVGTTVAFAMDANRRVYYSVLDLDLQDPSLGAQDAAYWNAQPALLPFAGELLDVAARATSAAMPAVKRASRTEAPADRLPAEDRDAFLSSTARLTAAAPLQVVSDGQYLLVFRQSITASDGDAVFQLAGGGLSGDPARTDYTLVNNAKVAAVDAALLCDRFVLVGRELKPVLEARYRCSRSKFTQAAGGDTIGTRDMDGTPFYEPTLILSFVPKLTGGAFSVLLLPTAVDSVSRWQLFAASGATGRVECFNLPRSDVGLFSLAGVQLYTSPDPKFANSVLERSPGVDPNTMQPLVPVPPSTDRGGTALRFAAGGTGYVSTQLLGQAVPVTGAYTVEAWVRPAAFPGTIAATWDEGKNAGFRLGLDGQGNVTASQDGATWTLTSSQAAATGAWSHVAAVYEGTALTLYLNGASVGTTAVTAVPNPNTTGLIGACRDSSAQPTGFFTGDIEEVRVWNRARTDFAARARRLTGIEAGLAAYYRLDEGAGATVYDSTRNWMDGTLNGPPPQWVTSTAPVGDGPGLARDTFAFAGRTVVSGIAATLYYQQEAQASGYSTEPVAHKRQGRVLLACATSGPAPAGGAAGRSYIATLDLALGRNGRLAQVPAQVALTAIAVPAATTDLTAISAAQAAVATAQATLNADQVLALRIPGIETTRRSVNNALFGGAPGFTLVDLNNNIKGPARDWTGDRERERKLRAQLADLDAQLGQCRAADQRLGTDQAALRAARDALGLLSGAMQGASEIVLAMPLVSTDRAGLSVLGALLAFAWTNDTPWLLDSSTGDVVLYFRGGDGQFFSAYYPTTVSHAAKCLTVADGTVDLIARDTSASLADFSVVVTDAGDPALCQVTVTRGSVTETFAAVPRAAGTLAAVLNGALPPGTLIGAVASAQDTTVALAAPLAALLPAGTPVTIAGKRRTTAADAAAGSTTITVTTGGLSSLAGGEVRVVAYDFANATCNIPGITLAGGSKVIVARAGTAVAPVTSVAATDETRALTARWRGDSPGRALSFDGTATYLSLPAASWPNVGPTGDLTVEAWANPSFVKGGTRIVQAALPSSATSAPYSLALTGAAMNSALRFSEATDWLDCGSTLALAGTDFTVELWARRTAAGSNDQLFGHGAAGGATDQSLHIGFRATNTFTFAFYADDLDTPTQYVDLAWHHWAVTYTAATRQRVIYCDGAQVAQDTSAAAYAGAGKTLLACSTFGPGNGTVELDEVRVWGRARSATDIHASMNTTLSGRETGLLGYWNFASFVTADRSGNHHDGAAAGNPAQVTSGLQGYTVGGSVGGQSVRSTDVFPVGQWGHVAMSFDQDWAVSLDGSGYLDAGGPDGLDVTDDLTIEAYLRLDTLGMIQGLVSKGTIGAGPKGTSVPYALYVQPDGQLAFTYETGTRGQMTCLSRIPLQAGVFSQVAFTRKGGANDKGGYQMTFYVNGTVISAGINDGAKPVGNDASCQLGTYRSGTAIYGLHGTLAQVRIWKTARDADQIGAVVTAKASGLIAWWSFPESRGATTADGCGAYPATLHGGTRVRTPNPRGNTFALYHNGTAVTTVPVLNSDSSNQPMDVSTPQFTVAGRQQAGGTLAEGFTGVLDEVRVWRTARTQEQITDNLFGRLRGERQDLLAYYPFDDASTVAGATVLDKGLRGNDLAPSTPPPAIALSTAPVSDDSAQVRSALTGVRTPFNTTVTGTPTASEYADLQTDVHGQVLGVMKRCYSHLRVGSWVLTTGFKIGDLVTTWIGQAQFAPQIIGYVEGAPPVPSENLIMGTADDYTDKAAVNFVQADQVTNTLSSDRNTSVTMSAKSNFDLVVSNDDLAITAPLGVGIAKKVDSEKLTVGGKTELNFSNGWSNNTQVSQGTTTTRTSNVMLTGHWEPADATKQANPTAGQRWVPANTGFAFVQSDTADQYALRLAHSGALVAYRMMPNPDIPRDWRSRPFPINSLYTKQGTLDGLVGYAPTGPGNTLQAFPDPSFPHAADPGAAAKAEFSYYRPREAYALKTRIQREVQQLQGFYESVSTETHAPDPTAAQAARVLQGVLGAGTALDTSGTGNSAAGRAALKGASRRNLANTYVWTAAGGLFAETTSTTDQVTEVTGGTYSVNGSVSFGQSGEFEVMDAGFAGGFEITLGGGYTVTRTKTMQAQKTFSLDVTCQPGRNLQQMTAASPATPVLDANGQPVLVPGRVDAYRFMSFYLDSSADNFEDFYGKVVDPAWLESADPNAQSLKQTRQADRKPPCWRILHRVTFVSRVRPTPAPTDPPSLTTVMRAQNIASDNALASQLAPYLGTPAPANLADLTTKATTAIAAHFPPYVPYTADIVNILAGFYNITV
jgi:hypothetical protein